MTRFAPVDARGPGEAALLRGAASALERGDFATAEQSLRTLLGLRPDHVQALQLLAVALINRRRFAEAETAIRSALKINKRDEKALATLAFILVSLGRPDEALETFDRALRRNPKNAPMLNNRGALLKDLGRGDQAIKDFDAAIAGDPNYLAPRFNKASALAALRRPGPALALYDEIVAKTPDFGAAWVGRGQALIDLGRPEEAVASFDRAIALDARDLQAHFNRGNALFALERAAEALAAYDRVLALDAAAVEANYNRANVLRALGRFEAAAAGYQRTVELSPDHAEAWNNFAAALMELGRLGESVAAFDRAVALKPGWADARYNRSAPLLLGGDFDAGWPAFEWRKLKAEPLGARAYRQPLWLGDEDIAGKTILVHWEQAFGDQIQFSRYLRLLERAGARVLFAPRNPLRRLLASVSPSVTIVDADDPALAFDFHCPLMSLPFAFRAQLATIPGETPYLAADPARVATWGARLKGEGFKVGVAWRGSAVGTRLGRSAPLIEFERLARPGIRLISLQKIEPADPETIVPASSPVESLGVDFDSGEDAFLDAAAAIANLDLVISVDTSIAHLAGALGAPVWIALRSAPDWRWLMNRSDSPWYPTARLFRQKAIADWAGVFSDIGAALGMARS